MDDRLVDCQEQYKKFRKLQYDAEWNEDNKNAEWYRQQAIHYKQLMDRGEFYEPNFKLTTK